MSRQNYLLRMAFCGSAYHGFQVQKNATTVCQVLQDAMQNVLQTRPDVTGCSRTDAGVHARDYCLNFFADTQIVPKKMPLAINFALPKDIRVFSAQIVPDDFHARYSAREKEYRYIIFNSQIADAFTQNLSHRIAGELNVQAMNEAAQHFLGTHSFESFMTNGTPVANASRTVTKAEVWQKGEHIVFVIAADGFLYNMVRIMAGTLLMVGRGKWPKQQVPEIIKAKNRLFAGQTLPPNGLYLNRVTYGNLPAAKSPQGPFLQELF